VHHQLGREEERHHHEKTDVRLEIRQEGKGDAPVAQMALERGQCEERYPRDQHEQDDAPHHQGQRIAREVPTQQELKQRTAVDEREVLGIPQDVSAVYRCWWAHFAFTGVAA
jgi:hypothetical protein